MLVVEDYGTGLNFHEWIEALLNVPDESTIGDFSKDLESKYEKNWLEYLISWRLQKVPQEIKEAKGLGSWHNPKIVIVTDKIHSRTKLPRGHRYWALPSYNNLRPFMENKKALKFFGRLTQIEQLNSGQTYITTFSKNWLLPKEAEDCLEEEMEIILPKAKLILYLDHHFESWLCKRGDLKILVKELKTPVFYTHSHNEEWENFIWETRKIVATIN